MIFWQIASCVLFVAVVVMLANIFLRRKQKAITETPFTITGFSIASPEASEDVYFDGEDRVKLYYKILDGITQFFIDDQLTEKPFNGFYCDGFYIITIKNDSTEFKPIA